MVSPIRPSYDALFEQAGANVSFNLGLAIDMLDGRFGKGYAQANPGLVGQLVVAMTADFGSTFFSRMVGELVDAISDKGLGGT